MHPSSEVEREYVVTVKGRPSDASLQSLRTAGDAGRRPGEVRQHRAVPEPSTGTGVWANAAFDTTFRVILREGRNREVRRMWLAVGHEVHRLSRVAVRAGRAAARPSIRAVAELQIGLMDEIQRKPRGRPL